jgi:hypothetical protein
MSRDEDDDLYDEEFDFVDDDDDSALDDESPLDEESPLDDEALSDDDEPSERADRNERLADVATDGAAEEPVDEYGRPEPAANYVVHVYEYKKFKRTIDRPFTPEDAETFATEFNRTGKSYGRVAVSGKSDVKPKKLLE